MFNKYIVPLPTIFSEKKEYIGTFLDAVLSHQYDANSVTGSDLTANDITFLNYNINTLAIYLQKEEIDLLINNSLTLYSKSTIEVEGVTEVHTELTGTELMKQSHAMLAMSYVIKVFKDMVGATYEIPTADDDFKLAKKKLLNTTLTASSCYESNTCILVFMDKEIVLNLGTYVNAYGIKNIATTLFEQITILSGIVKLYLDTLEECNHNTRVNGRLDKQINRLTNFYLHLLDNF